MLPGKAGKKNTNIEEFWIKKQISGLFAGERGATWGARNYSILFLKKVKENFVENVLQLRSKERVKALLSSCLTEILVLRLLENSV